MINRAGNVFIQDRLAGRIEDSSDGYIFTYEDAYINETGAVAVSLTMPLRRESYVSNVLFSFFDGLIPEGWLLDLIVDNWKINPRDRFGLLMVACKDCIGDVRIEEVEP